MSFVAQIEAILRLHDQGISWRQIGRAVGLSYERCRQLRLQALGQTPPPRRKMRYCVDPWTGEITVSLGSGRASPR
jgi:hypothetical protein